MEDIIKQILVLSGINTKEENLTSLVQLIGGIQEDSRALIIFPVNDVVPSLVFDAEVQVE